MMSRFFALPVALSLAVLAGCSNPEKTGRYLIDLPTQAGQLPNRIGSAELRDVSLPEYASDQEIAWQTEDGAVRSNPDSVWADSPERAVTLSLARAISDMSGATVIAEPWPLGQPPERELEVRIERALAQANGIYRLSGRYFVANKSNGGSNHVRSFDISVPLESDGPRATAMAQSLALSMLAQQIARLDGPGTTFVTRVAPDPFALDPIF